MKAVFIVGCGYIGQRVAMLEKARGAEVSALVRSDESARPLHNAGIETYKGDLDNPASLGNLPFAGKLLYYFVPPPSEGKTDPRMVSFLSTMTASNLPGRIVLISTSAVYGDCHGEWITEERPPRPQTDRALRRLSAEGMLTEWGKQQDVDIVILRVAGIYGPGRLPVQQLQEGRPVLRIKEAPFSNRIHADDLSHICIAA
ncbi:MAG: NAD-dependent epimerase/dehydratase family protein, partial [Proteobacteria bacterium]|nr:NAD-dependent epimerase/dehydratase family protein [Pseudomonadota bacterium]